MSATVGLDKENFALSQLPMPVFCLSVPAISGLDNEKKRDPQQAQVAEGEVVLK